MFFSLYQGYVVEKEECCCTRFLFVMEPNTKVTADPVCIVCVNRSSWRQEHVVVVFLGQSNEVEIDQV